MYKILHNACFIWLPRKPSTISKMVNLKDKVDFLLKKMLTVQENQLYLLNWPFRAL